MSSIPEPHNIKRIKVLPIECPKCKLTIVAEPDDEVCPVCGGDLLAPTK